ncbi:MAG: RidA family protein [Burkholderiales bacterium]|nr:RidA family protein [Burkholderiales bacterium]
MTPEEKLAQLGITLPPPAAPGGNYVPWVITGNLLFLAGKGHPTRAADIRPVPKVGREVSVAEAYQDARTVGIGLIGVMKAALGDLSRVRRVVKVLGMVNADPDFGDQPAVVNGCSDLFVEVFGERGRHARSAVGMGSLPRGFSVEIEAIVEFE